MLYELLPGGAQTPANVHFWVAASSQTFQHDGLSSIQLLLFHYDLQTHWRNFTRNPAHNTKSHEHILSPSAEDTALKPVL